MVDVVQESDHLWILLQRALDDNGVEGDVAWNLFAKKVKGRKGTIFFVTEDDAHPLVPMVYELRASLAAKTEEFEARLAAKTEELDTLRKKISKPLETIRALLKS